jgi:RNA polymerase sigma-70 factor (ECF subfamily)
LTGIDASGWIATHVLGHEPALRTYLTRFLSSAADVADVIQDTYTKLLALEAVERSRIVSPEAYLFATARHVALDRLRRQPVVSLEALTELERCTVLGYGPEPYVEVNAQQELALLETAIASLPERCRQVISLRAIEGMPQKEIAKRLGMAEHTVEKHLAHGVQLCAERMWASMGNGSAEYRASAQRMRKSRQADGD